MQTFLEILDLVLGMTVMFGLALALLYAREVLEVCVDIAQDLSHKLDRWWKGRKSRKE